MPHCRLAPTVLAPPLSQLQGATRWSSLPVRVAACPRLECVGRPIRHPGRLFLDPYLPTPPLPTSPTPIHSYQPSSVCLFLFESLVQVTCCTLAICILSPHPTCIPLGRCPSLSLRASSLCHTLRCPLLPPPTFPPLPPPAPSLVPPLALPTPPLSRPVTLVARLQPPPALARPILAPCPPRFPLPPPPSQRRWNASPFPPTRRARSWLPLGGRRHWHTTPT